MYVSSAICDILPAYCESQGCKNLKREIIKTSQVCFIGVFT